MDYLKVAKYLLLVSSRCELGPDAVVRVVMRVEWPLAFPANPEKLFAQKKKKN